MAHYEIGMVYRKGENYYLAVGRQRILTGNSGKVRAIDCSDRFERAKSVSVARLCRTWGISTSELDSITRSYLSPISRDNGETALERCTSGYEREEWEEELRPFIMAG